MPFDSLLTSDRVCRIIVVLINILAIVSVIHIPNDFPDAEGKPPNLEYSYYEIESTETGEHSAPIYGNVALVMHPKLVEGTGPKYRFTAIAQLNVTGTANYKLAIDVVDMDREVISSTISIGYPNGSTSGFGNIGCSELTDCIFIMGNLHKGRYIIEFSFEKETPEGFEFGFACTDL